MKNIMVILKANKLRLLVVTLLISILLMFVYKPRAIISYSYIDKFLINLGFVVKEINILGIENLEKNQIIQHITYYDCANLLCVNLKHTKKKLERLNWIKNAKLKFILPSIIEITVKEEKASFILKKENHFSILNFQGKVIETNNYLKVGYSDLLVLNGLDVKNNIYDLTKILDTSPTLAKSITEATFVSKRRWSLKYNSNIVIDLPEIEPEKAFKKISDLNKKYGLLSNKLEKIDLRLENRMIIKMKTNNQLLKESKI